MPGNDRNLSIALPADHAKFILAELAECRGWQQRGDVEFLNKESGKVYVHLTGKPSRDDNSRGSAGP